MKETTAFEKYAPKIFIGSVLILFTVMGFIIHPKGSEILWDKVHPFGFFDFIGCALFYGGAAMLMGFKEFMNPSNSSKWNLVTFAAIAVGILLIWFA